MGDSQNVAVADVGSALPVIAGVDDVKAVDVKKEESPEDLANSIKLMGITKDGGAENDGLKDAPNPKCTALLKEAASLIEKDPEKAKQIYKTAIQEYEHPDEMAIEKGGHPAAMYNLALLLDKGGEGVEQNPKKAAPLYELAIEKAALRSAMCNLALLSKGAEGLQPDRKRSVELLEIIIEKYKDPDAMFKLAELIQDGAEGVPADAKRAVQLYTAALEDEDPYPDTIINLAALLASGGEGLQPDGERALALVSDALEEELDPDVGIRLAEWWRVLMLQNITGAFKRDAGEVKASNSSEEGSREVLTNAMKLVDINEDDASQS